MLLHDIIVANSYFILQNFDYEVFIGARRQERRWDAASTEQVEATDKHTAQKLLTDPMFKLEHGKDDQIKAGGVKPVIDHSTDLQSRMKDDYAQNCLLPSHFRVNLLLKVSPPGRSFFRKFFTVFECFQPNKLNIVD